MVQTELCQGAVQYDCRVEVGECGGRGGVGQVVGRDEHGLHRGDRAGLSGGNTLLKGAHFLLQVRLVTHGAGEAAEEGRYFRTGLGEAEDVVDEEQYVAALIAETFS
jgi:hypothetical protein